VEEAVQANNAYGGKGGGQQATMGGKKKYGADRVSEICPSRLLKSLYQMPFLPMIVYMLENHLQLPMPGDTSSDPFPSSSAATHRFLMLDPHRMSLSDLRPYCAYHGLHRITSHLRIYYVPMFLDPAYV
jgi:hypothetical protein